eukprot:scaffold14.g1302.t1
MARSCSARALALLALLALGVTAAQKTGATTTVAAAGAAPAEDPSVYADAANQGPETLDLSDATLFGDGTPVDLTATPGDQGVGLSAEELAALQAETNAVVDDGSVAVDPLTQEQLALMEAADSGTAAGSALDMGALDELPSDALDSGLEDDPSQLLDSGLGGVPAPAPAPARAPERAPSASPAVALPASPSPRPPALTAQSATSASAAGAQPPLLQQWVWLALAAVAAALL